MKLDFEFESVRYVLDFDLDFDYQSDDENMFDLQVYHSLDAGSTYASAIHRIENGKIVWNENDNYYVSKSAQQYCDRLVKLIVFA